MAFCAQSPHATIPLRLRSLPDRNPLFLSILPTLSRSQQNETPGKEFAPDVPDAIAVPAGEPVQFFVMAKGSQIYTCQAGADGKFTWTLKGPDAELRDRKDKVIGQHFADPTTKLPTWKLKDGSEVTGKAAAHVDSLDSDSIPWLLVNVVSHSGKPGLLTNVTTIQRVHTHGGKPGNDACDEVAQRRRNQEQLHRRLLLLRAGEVIVARRSNEQRSCTA